MTTPKRATRTLFTAPVSALDVYGNVMTMVDSVGGTLSSARSETHPLALPPEVVAKLAEANEALKEATRAMERALGPDGKWLVTP